MKINKRKYFMIILACLIPVLSLSGCLSFRTHPKGIKPFAYEMKNKKYEVVKSSKGQSSGFKLFWFIPVTDKAALERAYATAINKEGGDNLINVRLWHERQYWIVGTIDVLYVEGDVIRYKD